VTVQKGEEQVGSRGSCATREMIYNRTSGGVHDPKKEVLPDISTIYHYEYTFTEADVFVGIRVFFHEGIGCDKFHTVKDCDSMLLQDEGLNADTVGELRMTTSTLQEGDVTRERSTGQGTRLLRGDEHKKFDAGVRLQKEVKKNNLKTQKEDLARLLLDLARLVRVFGHTSLDDPASPASHLVYLDSQQQLLGHQWQLF
jgi:hypothetical protein